jgi:nicotinate-nucleotide adenylyltransferase
MGRRVGWLAGDQPVTERWGILGGVFDPIHYAHLAIAEQARDELHLDHVVLVPANVPVHRDPAHVEAGDRVAMAELAIADNDTLSVSRIEVDGGMSGYTADTVARLALDMPDRRWVLILSAESAAHLPEWHEPERLIDLAEIAVVPRLGYANLPREWLDAHFRGRVDRFLFVHTSILGHSSSDIRARLAAGRTIRYLVPPAVERYIGEHGLYGADDRPEA